MEDRLPEFIIIGGMKCGTTSLYHYLDFHPDIGMSRLKETDYFIAEKNYPKGVDWYRSQFDRQAAVRGEASPNYTKAHLFPGVPERMHALIPDVKLIYLVRDPVARAVSHYTHNYAAGRPADYEHIMMCSRYHWQLSRFLEYFGENRILVLTTENLLNHRERTLREIYEFLDVEPFYSEQFGKKFGTSVGLRKRGRISNWLLGRGVTKILKPLLPATLRNRLKDLLHPPLKNKRRLPPEMIDRLKEDLRRDVEALRSHTGLSRETWDI